MKTNARYFKAVEAEMKLEQSIQRLNKGPEKTNEASGVCHCMRISNTRSPGYQQRLGRNFEIRFGKYRCKSFPQRIKESKYFRIQQHNEQFLFL